MSIFKYTDSLRNELMKYLDQFQRIQPLEMRLNNIKSVKQKKIDEISQLKVKLEELERDIQKQDEEFDEITKSTEKIKTSQVVFRKSIEELGITQLLQEGTVERLKENIQKHFLKINLNNQTKTVCLEYTSDFDGNGLFYWLGTSGGTTEFKNPLAQKLVDVTSTNLCNQNASQWIFEGHLASRDIFFKPPFSGPDSCWFTIDLLNFRISPTKYTLRAASANTGYVPAAPRNWLLEGSVDGNQWTTLSDHKNDTTLATVFKATASWTLQNPQEEYFRFIRFKQTGYKNYYPPQYLNFGGLEIYGSVIEIN